MAKLESGHTPSKRVPGYWDGDIPWVSLHDTDLLDRPLILKTTKTITRDGVANSSARILPAGTVVFSRTATVGKSTVIAVPMATSQDFANYICGPELHNKFLMYLFRGMQSRWRRLMAGSIHNTIYMPVFRSLDIVLPPIDEQRAIAMALSDVDALIDGLDRLIAKKRDFKQAAMQQLLTGRARLPGFGGKWEVKRLGDLADMASGGTPPSSVPAYYGGGIPWVSIADMTRAGKIIDVTEKSLTSLGLANSPARMFPAGTVLYAMYASLGECSIAEIPVSTSQAILGIRAKTQLDSAFLYYFLTSIKTSVMNLGQQGTQANLNKGIVQDLRLRLPSRDEQDAIANVLSDMDAECAALDQRRTKTLALKQAMMQDLLTGRVRLLLAEATGAAHA